MNLQEIRNFLKELFSRPLADGKQRHIVFWYDEKEDFTDEIENFDIQDVKVIKLTKNNIFWTKYYIEKDDTCSNILIYSNMPKPDPLEDWLYDIYCYSKEFSTDRSTVIMRELNITDSSLKAVFEQYKIFFRSKERFQAFKKLEIEIYTEDTVHLGVISVLTKNKLINREEILKSVINDYLDESHKLYDDLNRYGALEAFWNMIENYFGYSFTDHSMEKLMAMLLITNLNENIAFELPNNYKYFVSSQFTNCIVFLNHYMNDNKNNQYFNKLQNLINEKLNISKLFDNHPAEDFLSCDCFAVIDKIIINRLIELLKNNLQEYERYIEIINKRRGTYFYDIYKNYYKTIKWTIILLAKKKEIHSEIYSNTANKLASEYINNYYIFDKSYRKFYFYYDKTKYKDNLLILREIVENIYNNWYIQELSIKWFESLKTLDSWRIPGVKQQDRFYREFIKSKYKDRVFVIISDGLRYESAEELSSRLNNERRGTVNIEYMQSILPSYTQLGMAALLPHNNIEINDKYEVLIDGHSTKGTEKRNKILQIENPKSLALQYNEIMDMSESEIRKTLQGLDIVYIYHNVIDATGDHSSTEKDVFDATEKAINDIILLINKLVNRVSAANILVTADHGYIYKRSPMEVTDKISGTTFEDGEDNRRFLLTSQPSEIDGTVAFSMDYLLGENSSKHVVTPRGSIRFKVQGSGANYAHGGAMPQEVLVPVITFKNDRKNTVGNIVRKVNITLTSITRKITNPITFLEFFQEEKIQDKVLIKKLKCYFEDEEGNKISNIKNVIGDSRSDNPKDRSYRIEFVLDSRTYDKKKQYYLVIEDEDDSFGTSERIPFTIDIAIVDDFGF